MNALFTDLRVLFHLLLKPVRGGDHAARLEAFYGGQARDYDAFRDRLLPGRRELLASLPWAEGAVWVDLGGGTAANVEWLGPRVETLQKVYVVDLSEAMLEVARERIRERGWKNVVAVRADATRFAPDEHADLVTCSYSLTMIPDWFAAVDAAAAMLRPGGLLGVVDFFVARKHQADGLPRHGWTTRALWPLWFAADNVFLSPDHLPYLQHKFETLSLHADRARLPYLPLVRAPYYRWLGRKPALSPAPAAAAHA
jgi:S-adenosylmethionine-diacylgycerolhomoserine-N-methlytransferase